MLYTLLVHAHSGFRWVVLILLVLAVVNAFRKWRGKNAFTDSDRKLNLFALISAHLQLVFGFVLYFISPKVIFSAAAMKDAVLRFFLVEHSFMMVIAIALITIGYSRAKRTDDPELKFRRTFILYAFGLLVILGAIPWPFLEYGAKWF
jgi:hypothetical protein